ncbi:hypothetical protein NW755_013998 [Fusarium falciforme]|uniref:Sterigmatocystin biosynthesis monooxygenase stcW n=1 Tax=Fusarium falciforme TaxID=195108 RepID=A0A9W8QUZ0_9HYPO|nr:hypothetical protein NW755_013998 [Fusarium falciforme]
MALTSGPSGDGSHTAEVPPSYGQYPLYDVSRRPLHIIIVGAGASGIATLIQLKEIPNVTYQCFEKNRDVGGTWFETRYPGAACDIASHAYQYTFDSKKDWSSHFSPAEEIGSYFKGVAERNNLYPLITFNSAVVGATWDEPSGKWRVRVSGSSCPGTPTGEEEHNADVLINAGGILNDWKWPDIEGLDTFKGRLLHTAAWDPTIDLEGKLVAVIGSGASSIQVVPAIQPKVSKLDVYVRSPTYILPTVGFGIESSSFNEPYSAADIERFTNNGEYYRSFRKAIEQQMNENFASNYKNSKAQKDGRMWAENKMREAIKSPELQEKLIPSWELGCRRITPGLPYLNAVQRPNIDVIRTGISRVTEHGIETLDGQVREVDVLICATGFNTSFSSRFEILGRDGVSLKDRWRAKGPEAYLSLAIAGLPNYFTILGPNCPVANGSLVPCIEWSAAYIIQAIQKMQRDQIRTLEVKQSVQDAFNAYIQEAHKDMVWQGSCQSWYKDRTTGKITAVWPGSSNHFMELIESPRYEDFEIQYINGNPFWFMGNGVSQRETNKQDLTFYLNTVKM